MKERALYKISDGKFRIGIGCKDAFVLNSLAELPKLDDFITLHNGKTLFVFINYQLGQHILDSQPKSTHKLPLLRIHLPESTFLSDGEKCQLIEGDDNPIHQKLAIEATTFDNSCQLDITWKPLTSKANYLKQVDELKTHIQYGDIYEVNFCQQLESSPVELDSISPIFSKLYFNNPTPCAAFYESQDWMFASSSPEIFLIKKGTKLISKPIKGTAKRGTTPEADNQLKQTLETDPKERAENIMIVDLVRNDLSKIASKGSVSVDELCQVYTYPTVHQLISTISCSLKANTSFSELLKATFPMGSMTGAPKKSACTLIQKHEDFSRECYSGSFGVIFPNQDFELNVLIRTLLYLSENKQLTCGVGGAITINSDPEAEYEECKTKVEKIITYFGSCHWF
jgi:para-aminobenzoate synthetase component 1